MQNKIIKIQKMSFPWATEDPFLFCVHHEDKYPEGNSNFGPNPTLLKGRNIGNDFAPQNDFRMYHGDTVPGFPHHPHRGFETVTVATEGVIDHSDSLGAAGRFRDGDVQWMTAGKGVLHAEMFPLLNQDKPNPLELFQIWLNLPKKSKFVEPHFKMLWSEKIPIVSERDATGKTTSIKIIAGKLKEAKAPEPTPDSWAANPENDVAIWTIQLEPNAKWTLPKAKVGLNRTLYFYRGNELTIEGKTLQNYHSAQVKSNEEINIQADENGASILLLQGKPINEPVAQHGPFVMNTRAEIQEAFMDYQRTQFGGWKWENDGPVHSEKYYRFAKYADGRIEELKP